MEKKTTAEDLFKAGLITKEALEKVQQNRVARFTSINDSRNDHVAGINKLRLGVIYK